MLSTVGGDFMQNTTASDSTMNGRMYCAILGDIVASRKIPNRNAVQKQFDLVGCEINDQFQEYIVSKFTVVKGDEFQILLSKPSMAPEVIEAIRFKMSPWKLKIGVGLGLISTEINKESTMKVDGPAFYQARAAIERSKKNKQSTFFSGEFAAIRLVNSLYCFIGTCELRRSARQREVINLLAQERTQIKVASHLGVSQENISKMLNAAYYYHIQEAIESIEEYLGTMET
jgi:hypothetical protein